VSPSLANAWACLEIVTVSALGACCAAFAGCCCWTAGAAYVAAKLLDEPIDEIDMVKSSAVLYFVLLKLIGREQGI
jgi:hypothetical protein